MKDHFLKLCRNSKPETLLTVYNNCLIIDTHRKCLSFAESVAQPETNTKGSAFISRLPKQFFEGFSSSALLWLRADPTKTALASLDPQLHKGLQVFPCIASPLEWAAACSVEERNWGYQHSSLLQSSCPQQSDWEQAGSTQGSWRDQGLTVCVRTPWEANLSTNLNFWSATGKIRNKGGFSCYNTPQLVLNKVLSLEGTGIHWIYGNICLTSERVAKSFSGLSPNGSTTMCSEENHFLTRCIGKVH